MNENQYHNYGLIAELLSVATFRIQDMGAVSVALNFLNEARNEFESANQTQEATEAGSNDKDLGTNDPS